MDICNEVVFNLDYAVIICFILLFVVFGILKYLGYIDISFPKKRRENNQSPVTDIENNTENKTKKRYVELPEIEKPFQQQAEPLNSLQEEELGQHRSRIETLSAELENKKEELKRLSAIEKSFEQQAEQLKLIQDEMRQERSMKDKLCAELENEKEEKETALKRLSAIMSSRLRDGNPNVVDLSDQNRPVKIGEQFSELYDNEWTDAYGAVETYFGQNMQEAEIIKLLLDILEQCFMICKEQTDRQMSPVRENVRNIATYITKKATKLPEDLMQRIKEERKMFATDALPDYHEILPQVKGYFSQRQRDIGFLESSELEMFVQECLKLCWLMVVQDPPMAMIQEPVGNINDEFKAYKHRGNHVAFVVWPALLLEERGALLSKGVAEFHD